MNNKTWLSRIGLVLTSCSLSVLTVSKSTIAQAVVDLEFAFLLDGSGSINSSDFQLQLNAYKDFFSDPNFFSTYVAPLPNQKLALAAWQFGSNISSISDWILIDSQAAATTFSNSFLSVIQDDGLTNIGGAILTATSGLTTNAFDGTRLGIDISTDGQPTTGPDATTASINAIATGVDVINAIGVGSGIDTSFLKNNIVRGTNSNGDPAFLLTADNFQEFGISLKDKLARELGNPDPDPVGVPEPSSIMGLVTLAAFSVKLALKQKQG